MVGIVYVYVSDVVYVYFVFLYKKKVKNNWINILFVDFKILGFVFFL